MPPPKSNVLPVFTVVVPAYRLVAVSLIVPGPLTVRPGVFVFWMAPPIVSALVLERFVMVRVPLKVTPAVGTPVFSALVPMNAKSAFQFIAA